MLNITRREFLTTASLATGTAVFGHRLATAQAPAAIAPASAKAGSDVVVLGKTGIKTSILGLGTVHAFTIGFSKVEQIDETLEHIRQAMSA